MSTYDLLAQELREQRALAIQVIERQNELAESLSQQLQDAWACKRLWKRAAKKYRAVYRYLSNIYMEEVRRHNRKDAEIERLRDALEGLLLSADASWEERNLGHDWAESCRTARAVLNERNR